MPKFRIIVPIYVEPDDGKPLEHRPLVGGSSDLFGEGEVLPRGHRERGTVSGQATLVLEAPDAPSAASVFVECFGEAVRQAARKLTGE